jgi:hypothetical protein
MTALPKKLQKTYKKLLLIASAPTPIKELIVEGILRIYYLNEHMIISEGEFYQQFALWQGQNDVVCEIVGQKYLNNLQYTDWQKNKFLELGYIIDEMFGNYQKVIKITKDEDLLEIIRLFNKVTYEIMAYSKTNKFKFEFS